MAEPVATSIQKESTVSVDSTEEAIQILTMMYKQAKTIKDKQICLSGISLTEQYSSNGFWNCEQLAVMISAITAIGTLLTKICLSGNYNSDDNPCLGAIYAAALAAYYTNIYVNQCGGFQAENQLVNQ